MLGGWQILGPIPKLNRDEGELDRTLVSDETSLRPGKPITIAGNEYAWREWPGRMIDFIYAFDAEGDAGQNAIGYVWTEFTSDESQEAILAISHDDGVVVWLNGMEVHRNDAYVSSSLDQAVIKVSLKKGFNTLLAKVSQRWGRWEFAARLRPAGLDEPLVSLTCNSSSWGNMSRLPTLEMNLLDADGNQSATIRASGCRKGTPQTIHYTAFSTEPNPAPANVRIRYDQPGFVPFDKTYPWSEVRSGNVLLPLAAASPFRGRVIDAESGQPVTGARFQVDEETLPESTAENGRFELTLMDPLLDSLRVVAAGYEPREARVAWPPDDEWTIKLARGGHVLRGRLLTSDGKPLAGAVVNACPSCNVEQKVITDAEGRFEAIGLPGDRNTLYPTITHPEYIAKDGFNLPLDADGVTEVEWRLEPGAVVTGRVTAKDDDRPLAGIAIVSGTDRFASNRVAPEATTDADGRYRLAGVNPGPAMVHAFSEDFAPAMQTVTSTLDRAATADFELQPGKPITGRIIDPDGEPVAGVTLAIDTVNGARMLDRRVQTDSNGEFRYENMPDSPVRIDMFKRGWVSKRDNQFVGGERYDITLMPVVEHTVVIRLADTGATPAELTAQIGYQWPGREEVSWQDENYYQGTKYDAAAGVFRIRVDEPSTAKRSWRLRVAGYRDAVIDNPEPGARPQSLEVVLEKLETVPGKVVSAETGEPIEGIMVALVSKQDRLRLDHYVEFESSFRAVDEFTGLHATTAADGTFELPRVADETTAVDLVLFQKGGGFHYIRDARTLLAGDEIELPLPKAGAVEGKVIVAGKPVADESVHLSWVAPGEEADSWDLPFGFGGQVTTDAEGRFHYEGLGPGRYRICRIRSFKHPQGGGSMSSHLTGEEIIVLPGETITHDFNQPAGHKVTGQTVSAEGKPMNNCVVSVNRSDDQRGRVDAVLSDAEGRFTIVHLQPGSYTLSADQYEMTSGCGLGTEGAHGTGTVKVTDGDTTTTIKLAPRAQAQVARAGTSEAATLIGSVPPDFTGRLFGSDESFTLSDHFGKVVAIDFWATWCGPCMAVMPELKKLHEKYKDADDVVFVTVSLDQDAETLGSAMKEQGIDFPVIFESREASQAIANAFGVQGIPSSFVIGRNGRFAADKAHGSQLLATTEAAVKAPVDPAFADGVKPARLAVKLSLDDASSGVPGATIKLAAVDAGGKTVREETIRTPGQATQFTWLYPPLADGGKIQVTVEAENMPSQEKTVSASEAKAEVAFAFNSPRAIAGSVAVDDDKTPVPGMKITAYRQDGFRRTAISDTDGKFRIGVLPGTYWLMPMGNDDFAPISIQREQIEVAAESDPVPISIAACYTVTVTGTVTDEDGAAVAGAKVRSGASETHAISDEAGHFELRGVPSRGSVRLFAGTRSKHAMVTLEDFDGQEPQTLVLGQQTAGARSLASGAKVPRLTLYALDDGKPIEWRPLEDSDTLVVFAAYWHPTTRDFLSRAKTWADEHQAHFVPVSIDWSLDQARREAIAFDKQSTGPSKCFFAGSGGLEIAKDWNLKSVAQAYLVSPDGKIRNSPPPGSLP
jgi:thiol-disulfide isomerase/thioredoxin/protocatechuate 3,4-dioxygenase beta subunit